MERIGELFTAKALKVQGKVFLAKKYLDLCELRVSVVKNKRQLTKIFWVTCPKCRGEFYCHWQELRHKKIQLLCPYCSHQFLDEESPKIVE